jgi:hypothetical protein
MDGGYVLKDPAVGSATSIGRELLSSAEATNKAREAVLFLISDGPIQFRRLSLVACTCATNF